MYRLPAILRAARGAWVSKIAINPVVWEPLARRYLVISCARDRPLGMECSPASEIAAAICPPVSLPNLLVARSIAMAAWGPPNTMALMLRVPCVRIVVSTASLPDFIRLAPRILSNNLARFGADIPHIHSLFVPQRFDPRCLCRACRVFSRRLTPPKRRGAGPLVGDFIFSIGFCVKR